MKKKFLGVLCIAICFGMIFTGCSKVKDALSGNDSGSGAATEEDEKLESDGFINFEKMQFYINGKAYTLGKTTLQEMIDDGVPFETDDIANASNNLNSNTQSQGFKIRLGEYWTAQVYVMNDTDSNKTMSELAINEIYFPNKDDQTQDVITFAFPTNMSEEQFKKAAGKPTDVSNYEDGDFTNNRYKFTRKSTRYYSDWGYTFEFIKGKLSYFQMKYLE